MKHSIFLVVASACIVATAHGQQQRDSSLEGTMDRMMRTGMSWGWDTKALARGGDSCTGVLARYLADRSLSDREIAGALSIVDSCFYDPSRVEKPSDREPRGILLLLRYLEFQTSSSELRGTIAHARKLILDRYAAYRKQQVQGQGSAR
jgi:hypothetical protein